MNRYDAALIGDRLVLLACVIAITLYALGVFA